MNLAEKKALKTKYLLSGYSPRMDIASLAIYCFNEAKNNLPFNSGSKMIQEKATKYAYNILGLYSNDKLYFYLLENRRNRPLLRTLNYVDMKKREGENFPRNYVLKNLRSYFRKVMRLVDRQ